MTNPKSLVASQIGQLVIANCEQAAVIENLEKELQRVRVELDKLKPEASTETPNKD